jgi:hypothetical protein
MLITPFTEQEICSALFRWSIIGHQVHMVSLLNSFKFFDPS